MLKKKNSYDSVQSWKTKNTVSAGSAANVSSTLKHFDSLLLWSIHVCVDTTQHLPVPPNSPQNEIMRCSENLQKIQELLVRLCISQLACSILKFMTWWWFRFWSQGHQPICNSMVHTPTRLKCSHKILRELWINTNTLKSQRTKVT